jgi:3-hydroxybutyryl-CoA dehydratase
MYFEDLTVGQTVEIEPVKIKKADMLAFAETYDPIPLHMDEEYAKKTRYGRLIAPGVMVFMRMWAGYLRKGNFCGDELVAGKTTSMEWFLPVFEGDEVHGEARITALTPRNPYNGAAEITVDVYNQNGEHVLNDVTQSIVLRKRTGETK